MSFKDQLKKAVENAPERQAFVNVNYGKLRCKINVLSWHGKGQPPTRQEYVEGTVVKENQTLEIEFNIGVKELNPALSFDEWTRRVNVENGSNKGKRNEVKTDWESTVMPSLEAVFGPDEWYDVALGKKTWYVAVEQADSVNPPAKDKKDYGAPKFIAKYKTLKECAAAREERFGKQEENNGEEIPEAVSAQVVSLFDSVKKNADQFLAMLDNLANVPPFNTYSKAQLAGVVGVKVEAE